ncbi:hypothetical protein H634G_09914 [Metarhizium anisopliae BRIP 53293]|uniref:Beta-lactamase-related domain-containing protein n=1 Tax=Metarhizium anisopliae BRIP 53293 TaxID=1291518 RepID=A0A0D9NQG6_METAN|nr:hypothetical protein H634G_09914 [Metarhizium anisopliae BRIP 53293]KJK94795.1 hypothetical protein H633G_01305 [Metarhizium anisopliae BRIP 53284]
MDLFRSPEFASRVEQLIKKHHTPGLAIAIVHNGQVASAAYGNASLDPPKPMTTDTLFDVASASKSLTAASVALIVEDYENHPEVKYDARMSDLLPDDFAMPSKEYDQVTLDDALGHRTGLSSNDYSYFGIDANQPDDACSVTRNIRNLLVAAPIRTKYIYCNAMYTAVTHLVEKKTGTPFADFLRQRFFEPLDMKSSFLQPKEAREKGFGDRLTPGHYWDKDKEEYLTFNYPDCPEGQGAGSVVTSVNDYIKYVQAMLNKDEPFTEDVYKGILKPRTIVGLDLEKPYPYSSPRIYASGWHLHHYRGYNIVAHDGGIPGCSTTHMFMPELKFGCVVFGNAEGACTIFTALTHELIDDALNLPEDQRLDWEKVEMNMFHGDDDDDDAEEDEDEQDWQAFFPDIKECQSHEHPLEVYTGHYWHAGYRGINVQVRDGQLFVDANDRSFAFTLTFKHVCEQTKFVAYLCCPTEGLNDPIRAEFRFGDDGSVTHMGVQLDEDLDDLIWFEKTNRE